MGREHQGADRTARFWVWANGGWVKLSLRYARDLRHTTGGTHEEGYSCTAHTWTHTGDGVLEEWASWGRDCDGRHEDGGEGFAPLDQLAAVPVYHDEAEPAPLDTHGRHITQPMWANGRSWRRDHTAEAAGY